MARKPFEPTQLERQAILTALRGWRAQWFDLGGKDRAEMIDVALISDLFKNCTAMQDALQRFMKNREMSEILVSRLMLLPKPPTIQAAELNEIAVLFRSLERVAATLQPFVPRTGPKRNRAQVSFIKEAALCWAQLTRTKPTASGRFGKTLQKLNEEERQYPLEGLNRERIETGLTAWRGSVVGEMMLEDLESRGSAGA